MSKRQSPKTNAKGHSRPASILDAKIRVGDISGGVGFAIGPGAQAIVNQVQGVTADEIATAFEALHQKVNAMPNGPDKAIAASAVKTLESEAHKGEQASESQVRKWMNFLAETAPDAWDVAIDTFTNPIKGIGTVFKKIADKAKSERVAKKADQPAK
jgi:hypothetical protein